MYPSKKLSAIFLLPFKMNGGIILFIAPRLHACASLCSFSSIILYLKAVLSSTFPT